MNRVIVWDIETVLDIKGFAAANGHEGKGDDEIRAAMGDKFPKCIYLSFPKIPSGLVAGPTDHRGVSLGISSHLLSLMSE
jgi:3'-5' exonuclease